MGTEGVGRRRLLRLVGGAGIDVVTTRNEFFYGAAMDPEIRSRIEQACQQGSASIHATGSSPGYSTTTVPLHPRQPHATARTSAAREYAGQSHKLWPVFFFVGCG